MNSTYFFTDFAKQQAEFAQLKFLKSHGSSLVGFIGLYGNASILAAEELNAENASIWQTLSGQRELYACPSAAARRGIDTTQPPRPGLRWLSLAGMLQRLAPDDGEPQAIAICLASDCDWARTEALELCLAALALDFEVQLHLRGAGILGLQRSLARNGAKGYASLALFGLTHAWIASAEIAALAPLQLLADSLSLPWQIGAVRQVPLLWEF